MVDATHTPTDHEHYVSRGDWLVPAGRNDLIDEIADGYERARCAVCDEQQDQRAG